MSLPTTKIAEPATKQLCKQIAELSAKHGELCSSTAGQIVVGEEKARLKLAENDIARKIAAAKNECRRWFDQVGGVIR